MLQENITTLVNKLHNEKKHILAETIEKYWDTTIFDYSAYILDYSPTKPMEKALVDAFRSELIEQGRDEMVVAAVLHDLAHHRVIQTAHHSNITDTPRMLCIDWITTAAMPANRWYVVGAFSGVPFSNACKPGRILFADQEVNFIPKTMQDALVYSSVVPHKSLEQYALLPDTVKKYIPAPELDMPFSKWTCQTAESINRKVLQKDNVVFLDINNVITRYLLSIIDIPTHPISQILFDADTRTRFFAIFGADIHLFYAPYNSEKYSKQESLYFDGYDLSGKHTTQSLNPDELRRALEHKEICPAAILVFAILSFINHAKCLGSFAQIEYLPRFQKQWQEMGFDDESCNVPTKNLTTGMFPMNPKIQALDILLADAHVPGNYHDLLGEYLLPIWETDRVYASKQGHNIKL